MPHTYIRAVGPGSVVRRVPVTESWTRRGPPLPGRRTVSGADQERMALRLSVQQWRNLPGPAVRRGEVFPHRSGNSRGRAARRGPPPPLPGGLGAAAPAGRPDRTVQDRDVEAFGEEAR